MSPPQGKLCQVKMNFSTHKIGKVVQKIEIVVKGHKEEIKLALTALLAKGHLLLEGIPGLGKTTLALSLARSLGCSFQRIQFTSDLLPADILGVSIYDKERGEFIFKPGPIFHHIILADEINRATPRTQSALLEAMGEKQVSIEGKTLPLPDPFLVIATQNPLDSFGTFPLPDSQLDRFFMRLRLEYPSRDAEREVLSHGDLREVASRLSPVSSPEEVREMQKEVEKVKVDPSLMEYILDIIEVIRKDRRVEVGPSTRGALYLLMGAKARAYLDGRNYVIPDDIKRVAPHILSHRIRMENEYTDSMDLLLEIIEKLQLPL